MTKVKQSTLVGETLSFTSIADLGYKQARIGDSLMESAKYAIAHIAGFPDDVPAESKAELYVGYFKRYGENNPPVTYAIINGHYVRATLEHVDNKAVEKVSIGVDYAFSLSPIEFGKLKATEPERHAVIAKVRNDAQTYASNRLGDLKRAAKKLATPTESRSRATLDFIESVTKAFDAFDKSVKVKESKGDATASAVKFRTARDAFWKTYNA